MAANNKLCPNCRTVLIENATFCVECGSRIDYALKRSELQQEQREERGLLLSRDTGNLVNPFLSSAGDVQKKIIEPQLKALEKKRRKIVFREWESQKPSNEVLTACEVEEIAEEVQEEAENIPDEPSDEELVECVSEESAEELAEEVQEEAENIPNELPSEVESEDVIGNAVDEPILEEPIDEEANIPEELPGEVEREDVIGNVVDEPILEEPIDEEDSILDEPSYETLIECIVEEDVEELQEESSYESCETQKTDMPQESEPAGVPFSAEEEAESEAIVLEETVTGTVAKEQTVTPKAENKSNRIITSPVGGGFKRKEAPTKEKRKEFILFNKKNKGENR